MKKFVLLVSVPFLMYVTWLYVKPPMYHKQIAIDKVESSAVWDEKKGSFTLTKDQQKALVEAFNSAQFVDDNDELAGTTYGCHAGINLKSGDTIWLGGCGSRPEVQRSDNVRYGNRNLTGNVAYFIESPEMEQLIQRVLESKKAP